MLALSIAGALFGSVLALPASAAVKAGAACAKVGSSGTTAGKKFTCVKSGKKLVWNKGVAVAKPVAPLINQTPVSPAESASELIAKKAFEILASETMPRPQIQLKFETGSGLRADFISLVTQATNNAAGKYSLFLTSELPTTAYLYSELDLGKVKSNSIMASQQDILFFFDWYAKDKRIRNNSIALAGHVYRGACRSATDCDLLNAAGAGYPSYSTTTTQDEMNLSTISHELFHVIQDVYLYENLGSIYLAEEAKFKASPPIFREGAATFMQCATSFNSIKAYESCLDGARNWIKNDIPKFKEIDTPAELVNYLSEIEGKPAIAPHYGLGAFATEWLIYNYGLAKFVDLVKTHSMKKDFKSVFLAVYDFPLDKLYVDSAEYLLQRMKL